MIILLSTESLCRTTYAFQCLVTQVSLGRCCSESQPRGCNTLLKMQDLYLVCDHWPLVAVCVWRSAFPSSLSSAVNRMNWSSLRCSGVTWFPLLFLYHLCQDRRTRVAPWMGTDHSAFDQPASSKNSSWLAAPPGRTPADLPKRRLKNPVWQWCGFVVSAWNAKCSH